MNVLHYLIEMFYHKDNWVLRSPSNEVLTVLGIKRVAWPPPPEDAEIVVQEQAPVYAQVIIIILSTVH